MSTKKVVSPSREKYDHDNPVISIRVPIEFKEQLEEFLSSVHLSLLELLQSIVSREVALAKQRIESLVMQSLRDSDERLNLVDDFICQLICTLIDHRQPILCPRCEREGQFRLFWAEGYQTTLDQKKEVATTWKCLRCGWYLDVHGRIDSKSLRWEDSDVALVLAQNNISSKK